MPTDERLPSQLPRHLLFALIALGVFACMIVGTVLNTPAGKNLTGVDVIAGIGALIAYVVTSE
jgi:hypothetical protein